MDPGSLMGLNGLAQFWCKKPLPLGSLEKRQLYILGGNLKRHKKLKALSQHHFIVPDCDDFGDLLQTYVFVQIVGIMLGNEFDHIFICHKCNEEAESLQQILMKGKR